MVYFFAWGLAGWLMGAAVNLLSDHLPKYMQVSRPSCIQCGNTFSWGMFIALRRCPSCGLRRSIRSWIVQLGIPILAIAIWILPHERIPSYISFILLSYFVLVAVIDIEHRLILGPISLAGIVLGILTGIILHDVPMTAIGGIAGAAIMFILYQMGRLFSGWLSRRRGEPVDEEALGFGDVYIAAIIGLILGWPGITAGLFLAILAGGLVSGIYLLGMVIFKRYQPFMALPYAPFLLLATVALLYRP